MTCALQPETTIGNPAPDAWNLEPPVLDLHAHVFCWGEDPREGFISEGLQRSFLTRLMLRLLRIRREEGKTITEKFRSRLLRDVRSSSLDAVVVLAQDAAYLEDGTRDEGGTSFHVSNDYVFGLARECPKILAGGSINPWRRDRIAELERCAGRGAALVKIHTAAQGVDPALPRFDPFYRRAAELKIPLLFHTGYEHSCPVVSQSFADPRRLARALEHGGTIIAAHCGTCAFVDPEDFYPGFVEMMERWPNLYGDTAVLATIARPRALPRLDRAPERVRERILHGSDYPFPPATFLHAARMGLFPPERANALDLDLAIKRAYDLRPGYPERAGRILKLSGAAHHRHGGLRILDPGIEPR